MEIMGLDLAWVVVKDIRQAIQFYTEVVGLQLNEFNEEFGWAELSGSAGGARLGIAQVSDREAIQPGQNAVITLTVKNLAQAISDLSGKGAKMIGAVVEVPGAVKLQMVRDSDGNHFQLVESFT